MTHVHSINAPTNMPTFTDEPEVVSDLQEKCKILTIAELRKKFDTGGLSGLVNMGNTCYMNAALQCLSATIEFVEYFRGTGHGNGEYKKDLKQGTTRILFEERKKRKRETPDKITDDILLEIRARFRKSLTYRLRNLLVVMWGINCKVQPKTFKNGLEKLQREDFRGFSQEDSPLCLLLILDQIHEETKTDVLIDVRNLPEGVSEFLSVKEYYSKLINTDIPDDDKIKLKEDFNEYRVNHYREDAISKCIMFWQKYLKKNHSVVTDIFTGLTFTQIQCQTCKIINFNYDVFNMLAVSIPSKSHSHDITLDECLKHDFGSTELLTGDNKYFCDHCSNKHDAMKTTAIWHVPSKLIIHLKRFTNNGSRTSKNTDFVNFPLTGLDLKDYISQYSTNDYVYDLYAVIVQSGSLRGGHYIAYTKNPINDEWYRFDDQNILHIPKDKIESNIVTSGAYVLFYKKRESAKLTSHFSDDDDDEFDII
jgi:ubiquitin carboxyl-terminal hydrolase 8